MPIPIKFGTKTEKLWTKKGEEVAAEDVEKTFTEVSW
jgi:molecular chaperone HtpG